MANNMFIQCQASSGPSDLSLVLYHNGTEMVNTNRIIVSISNGFGSAQVTNVMFEDAGIYTCNASIGSHFGTQSVEASITG